MEKKWPYWNCTKKCDLLTFKPSKKSCFCLNLKKNSTEKLKQKLIEIKKDIKIFGIDPKKYKNRGKDDKFIYGILELTKLKIDLISEELKKR